MQDDWKSVCAWCGKLIAGDEEASHITHGCCYECYIAAMEEIETLYSDVGGEG